MEHKKVKLWGVKSPDIQSNILLFGNSKEEPYDLIHEPAANDECIVRVVCNGNLMGYLPNDVALKVAKLMASKGKYKAEARFVKLNKHREFDIIGLTVDIITVRKKKRKKMADKEYFEAKEWQQKWIDRYGSSKWY